jgi:hypothetical protein
MELFINQSGSNDIFTTIHEEIQTRHIRDL